MSQSKLHPEYLRQKALQDAYLARKNKKTDFYNGIYDRWENPVLTRESIPLSWRFDLTNPHFMERLGVNAVFNSGAIKLNGKYYLVARIEGNDRKSFFGVAESDSPVEGFHFWEKPILLPDTCPEETNVYGRHRPHQRPQDLGASAEPCHQAQPPAAQCGSAAGVRQRQVRLLHPPHG